jgi:hypothetical protein
MKRLLFLTLAGAFLYPPFLFSQTENTARLSGTIKSKTGERVPRASVSLIGTKNGSIANKEGGYSILLEKGKHHRLRITAVGYEPDTLGITLDRDIVQDIILTPTPVRSGEIVVTSDASRVEARRIMHEVIRRKKLWRDKLTDYKCSAYSRWNFRSISGTDTTVRSVAESNADGYWRKDKGFYERITARKQTANFPAQANAFSIGTIMNFYDDRIDFDEYQPVTPVADDAFDTYDYDLIGTGTLNGSPVYKIILDPSVITPAFDGTLWIDQNDYTIAYLDLTPNKAVKLGPLKELRFEQTFDLFRDTFWLPIDLRTNVLIKLEMPLIPQFKLELLSVIKDYTINGGLHDSLFAGKEHIALPGADSVDSAKWEASRPIPLALDEAQAYHRIDSTVATEKEEEDKGFSAWSLLPSPDVPVFNQIEHLRLGINKDVKPAESFPLRFHGEVAYGFRDEEWKYTVGFRQGLFWTSKKQSVFSSKGFSGDFRGEYKDVQTVYLSLGAKYYHDLFERGTAYSHIETSITSLIYTKDYQEFYRHEGFDVDLEFTPSHVVTAKLTYENEKINDAGSLHLVNDTTANPKRKNNSLSFGVSFEPDIDGLTLGLDADLTASSKDLGSDATYTIGSFSLDVSRRFGGWGVTNIIGRYEQAFAGELERWNTLYFETRNKFFSKSGEFRGLYPFEFMGDRTWAVHLDQNFYDLPTRITELHFMDDLNLQWHLHGGIGGSDIMRSGTAIVPTTNDKPYGEVGFGIGNIMNIIYLDATWRLTHKRETNFYPSVAVQFTF